MGLRTTGLWLAVLFALLLDSCSESHSGCAPKCAEGFTQDGNLCRPDKDTETESAGQGGARS